MYAALCDRVRQCHLGGRAGACVSLAGGAGMGGVKARPVPQGIIFLIACFYFINNNRLVAYVLT